MMITKLSTFKLLSKVPFVGDWAKLEYYKLLLVRFDEIETSFARPTVRFADAIRNLYDHLLAASQVPLEEDFQWFNTMAVKTHTTTSSDACSLLEALDKGMMFKVENAFRGFEGNTPRGLLKWYSSNDTVELFFAYGVSMVEAYCVEFSDQENERQVFSTQKRIWNQPLNTFLTGRYFKMMVDDLITVARIALHSQIRVLNGEVQKTTKG